MKKAINFLFVIVSLTALASCSKKSENFIHIFYNAKFKLSYAAFNSSYNVSSEPAYCKYIKDSTDCINLFDVDRSYCTYRTEIIENKPVGKGEIKICFKDSSLESFAWNFEYYSDYDKAYGGQLHVTSAESNVIGTQHVRGKYWWTRMDCTFPQLENKRVILEFTTSEVFDDLEEFDGNTIFS